MEIKKFKNKLFSQQDLTSDESMCLFELIMSGKLSDIEITAILISLKLKGLNDFKKNLKTLFRLLVKLKPWLLIIFSIFNRNTVAI